MQSGQEWTVFVSLVHDPFRIIKGVYTNFDKMITFLQLGRAQVACQSNCPCLGSAGGGGLASQFLRLHLEFGNSTSAGETRIFLFEKNGFKGMADRVNLSLFSALKPSSGNLNPCN